MRRFFVPQGVLGGPTARISGELFRHIATVLRLTSGDSMLLADESGNEALARITALEKDAVIVELEALETRTAGSAGPRFTIYQGLPKGDKIEMILQKATELGAAAIIPFRAVRSLPKLAGERREKKLLRWEKIVREAARQSGRRDLPQLGYADNMGEILEPGGHSLKILLWEGETEQGLKSLLSSSARPEDVAIIIGPEGGLTSAEAAAAVAAGYLPVTLGGRILRTETAGLAVLAILQYVWGDLG